MERLHEPPDEARIRATAMQTMARMLQGQREKNEVRRHFRDSSPVVFARLFAFTRKFSAEDQRLVDDDTSVLLLVHRSVKNTHKFESSSEGKLPMRPRQVGFYGPYSE